MDDVELGANQPIPEVIVDLGGITALTAPAALASWTTDPPSIVEVTRLRGTTVVVDARAIGRTELVLNGTDGRAWRDAVVVGPEGTAPPVPHRTIATPNGEVHADWVVVGLGYAVLARFPDDRPHNWFIADQTVVEGRDLPGDRLLLSGRQLGSTMMAVAFDVGPPLLYELTVEPPPADERSLVVRTGERPLTIGSGRNITLVVQDTAIIRARAGRRVRVWGLDQGATSLFLVRADGSTDSITIVVKPGERSSE